MKHLSTILFMAFALLWQTARAAETEPNNTAANANTLSLNGSNTGKISVAGDVDWWKVTTTGDGKLDVKLTPHVRKGIWVYLYDNNGTTLLKSGNDDSIFTQSADGLAAGTYYIKVVAVAATDTASYTIGNTLATPTQANDIEPNNVHTQAVSMNLNSTKTGHIGYYYKNIRDTSDWYKITTTTDKKVKVILTPANGQSLTVLLYASNGTSLISSASGSSAFSLTADALGEDVYYIKVRGTSSSTFAPYTLTDSVYTPTTDALILPLNFRYQDKIKTPGAVNWWKITTTGDGKLNLTLTPLSGKYVWVYLYDNDRTTLLNSSYSNSRFLQSTDGLAAGTYYVKVAPYYSTDTASYTLADTLHVPSQANDAEPNNTPAQAVLFNVNSTKNGHTGYYYNKKRDSADWYKITTTADGMLNLKLTPANGSHTWAYLYDTDGITLLNSSYSNTVFTQSTDGLAAGTYYVKVTCYYNNQFTPYTLNNTLTLPAQVADTEPNNTRAQAVTLSVNSTTTGHVGYYNNKKRDTADWFKITIAADGLLKLKLTPANGAHTWVYLYDNNGSTLLNSSYSNIAFTQSTDGLAAGTYYVKVNCYYNNQFAPYTFTDSLSTYGSVTETEPNTRPYQGKVITTNTTAAGHAGFYYNVKRDSLDWWKLGYTGSGSLQLNFKLIPNKVDSKIPHTWFYVYKDTLATPVYASYFNTASNTISLSSLSKTTYYIKIITYYNTDFVRYSISNPATAAPMMTKPSDRNGQMEKTVADEIVSLFPNPATDRFQVRVGSKGAFTAVILSNASGRQVWSRSGSGILQQGEVLQVNVAHLPAGLYFLQLTDAYNKTVTKKIVITK